VLLQALTKEIEMKMDKSKSAHRTTAVGVFHSHEDAAKAVAELKRVGFREDEISLVGKNEDGEVQGNKAAVGAATGAAVGAGAAALASLGMTFGVIPIIGPVLAVGPLAATLISAASGAAAVGLAGGLIGMGLEEGEAKYYEGEVHAGRYLVTVNAQARYDEAWTILHRFGAYNHETAATSATAKGATGYAGTTTGEGSMKLHEEQLRATKHPVETGEVRVRKEVVTEHKTLDVPVTREEVVVERRAVGDRTATSADIRPGEEVRIPVREEKVSVDKQAVVKEEVNVSKRKVQDTEHVGGTVRKEEVHIEQEGDVDVRTKGGAKKGR